MGIPNKNNIKLARQTRANLICGIGMEALQDMEARPTRPPPPSPRDAPTPYNGMVPSKRSYSPPLIPPLSTPTMVSWSYPYYLWHWLQLIASSPHLNLDAVSFIAPLRDSSPWLRLPMHPARRIFLLQLGTVFFFIPVLFYFCFSYTSLPGTTVLLDTWRQSFGTAWTTSSISFLHIGTKLWLYTQHNFSSIGGLPLEWKSFHTPGDHVRASQYCMDVT